MLQKSTIVSALLGALIGALSVLCCAYFILKPSTPKPSTPNVAFEEALNSNIQEEAIIPSPLTPSPMDPLPIAHIPEQQIAPALETPLYAMFLNQATAENGFIELTFSTPENILLTPGENLLISPEVKNLKVRHSWWNENMRLTGDFQHETEYTITIKADTVSARNEKLLNDVSVKVQMPAPKPSFELLAGRGQMALTPDTSIPCKYLACDKIKVEVWKAFPNNLINYGQTSWKNDLLEKITSHTFTLPKDTRTQQYALLPIYDLVNGTPGVYRFRFSIVSDQSSYSESCYIILSNIGATYAYDHRLTPIVALHNLVDGTPIEGAYVALYDTKNQLIAAGVSDAQGIAATEIAPEASARTAPFEPSRMIISAEDDVTIIECDYSTRHSAYDAELKKAPTFPTALWPDRDAIHPGERVQLYGLVRDASLTAVNELPLKLELYSPYNRLLQSENVVSNRDGYFTQALTIPTGVRHGYYTVKVILGNETLSSTEIYVSDFTPNHVKLSLEFPDKDITRLNLTAKTYFGTPVTKGSGNYNITMAPAPLPTQWRDWTIGSEKSSSSRLNGGTFNKDDPAETITLEGVKTSALYDTMAPVRLTATATFSEPNNRAVTATTTIDQTPHNAYLAMQYDAESQSILFKQYFPEGSTAAPGSIKITALKEHHSSYELVQDNNGWRYQWTSYTKDLPLNQTTEPLNTVAMSLTEETLSKTLTHLPPGHYSVSAMLNDTLVTTITFWHNLSWEGKKLGNPYSMTFTADKTAYKPGETAQITFNASTDGRVIVTGGDTELRQYFTKDVTAGTVTLPVPIPENTYHGAWSVGVTLLPKNVNNESRYFGVAVLDIDHSPNKLNLTLTAPKHAKPNENITLNLNLTTATGQPCRGTVALFAVDESVLDVTGFETPDPYVALFTRNDTPFAFGDIYGTILPQLRLLPDGRIGGDKLLRARRTFDDSVDLTKATTVITLPLQEIDATGTHAFPITLPDFKGTLRFMAIVANETMVGATDATVIVRLPVSLSVAGPRYGCAGDTMETTVRLINHDLPAGPYTLTIADQTFTGELAPGATVYHAIQLPVGKTTATLQMGDFTTSVTHKVAIQEEVPKHAKVQIKILKEGETLPEDAEPLPSIESIRKIALNWLMRYRYTCTEQLSSRLLPYTSSTDEAERSFVKQTFNRLATRLTATGGFSLWDGSTSINITASLFASQVLIEGIQSDILSKEHLPRVINFLHLLATSTLPKERAEAAYACYLLGEANAKTHAVRAARNLLVTSKTDPAAFMAATTLVLNGAADEGAPIMKDYLQANPFPKPLLPDYMTETAAQAMTLYFAMRAGVISNDEIEVRLAKILTYSWETTQTCTWVARALSLCSTLPTGQRYKQLAPVSGLPQNAQISVIKRIVDREGNPVNTLKHGDLAYIKIIINSPRCCDNLILRDRLPGGLEYEDSNLATRESAKLPQWATTISSRYIVESFENTGAEIRFFGSAYQAQTTHIYPVRATTKGTFAIPAAIIEDMYAPDYIGGHDPETVLTIQ